ncbi:MAG: NAD-dependent aldehyde dehydrogenase, partial [Candidatus Eremiobacterota bacterium]
MSTTTTSLEQIDDVVARLRRSRDAWAACDTPRRLEYLRRCRLGVMRVRRAWVQAVCRAKGIPPSSQLTGEEWFLGPAILVGCLKMLEVALEHGGRPPARGRPGPG